MSFRTLVAVLTALAALIISLAAAVQVSVGLPDGLLLYTPPQNTTQDSQPLNDGWELIEAFEATTAAIKPRIKRSAKMPRYSPLPIAFGDYGCAAMSFVDPSDYLMAWDKLATNCNKGFIIPGNSILVYKVGSTAVYACSFGGPNPCDGGEIEEAMNRLDDEFCHDDMMTGWVLMKDWKKSYGRELVVNEICYTIHGSSRESSPATSPCAHCT